jgi:hypothetical protein
LTEGNEGNEGEKKEKVCLKSEADGRKVTKGTKERRKRFGVKVKGD